MVIKRVRPSSFAKVSAALYAIMGLLGGGMFSLIALTRGLPPNASPIPGLFGMGAVVILPLLYGALGYVVALFSAWLYNLIAGWVGGIEMDVQ